MTLGSSKCLILSSYVSGCNAGVGLDAAEEFAFIEAIGVESLYSLIFYIWSTLDSVCRSLADGDRCFWSTTFMSVIFMAGLAFKLLI